MRQYRGIVYVLVVLAVLAVATAVVLAAEGAETDDPWQGVLVTFGGVTLAWSGVQMALLQLLKSIKIGDEPLLNSSGLIWLVNAMLGAVGLIIAATQGGTPLLVAAIQALIAVFAASGEFEALKKAGVLSGNLKASS